MTDCDSERHYGRHWHDEYGLGVLERGGHRSASGRGQVDAHAGELLATNPGEVHDGQPLGGIARRWRMVYWTPALMQAALGDATAPPPEVVRPVFRDASLQRAVRRLLRQLQDEAADVLACEQAWARTVGLLLARHTGARPPPAVGPAPMQGVREQLADNLGEPPTLASLAAPLGLSPYQLLRRFSQAYGITPHAWLLQCRAERARGLIRHGSSLADAATAAGFADQSHLTRVFGQRYGYSPGLWQRAVLGR